MPDVGANAAEVDYGADLRQNVLVMSWPAPQSPLLPRGSFGISGSSARINARVLGQRFVFTGAVETVALFSSSGQDIAASGGLFARGRPLEMVDATIEHVGGAATTLATRLERFDLLLMRGQWSVEAGRQPVSLGTSHFVGILDILAPFAPGNLDATYKPGIDAVRIRRSFGISGEAELIGAGAADIDEGALLGRLRHTWRGFDFEWIAGRFRQRGVGGIGWEGEYRETAFWGELALFERRPDAEPRFGGLDDVAVSGVIGTDLNLPRGIDLGLSGMYQDFGVRDPEDLPAAYASAPFREGWLFLAAAAYGVVTVHRELHPLVQGDLASILNLVDGSTIWQPRITVSSGDNSDLAFYGWIGTGKEPSAGNGLIRTRSEFGGTPRGGGFYARWFF